MMKLSVSCWTLVLVAAVNAAPNSPVVVSAPEDVTSHNLTVPTARDHGVSEDASKTNKQENDYLDDSDYSEDDTEDVSGAFESDIDETYTNMKRRLIEDNNRLQHDLLLIRRLMGLLPFAGRSGGSSFSLWGFPSYGTPTNDTDDADYPTSENGSVLLVPVGDFDFPTFGFGLDRPLFSNFPDLPVPPTFPNVDDLPDNYDNSTHEVHVVNGTRIEVNTTTNKESEDGFKTFFHTEVIAIRPEDDHNTTTTQTEEGTKATRPTENGKPTVPEVENEAGSSGVTLPPVPEVNTSTTTSTSGIFL